MDKCPPNPYFLLQYSPMSRVTDFQWLKMQEDPKTLPPGEVPRQLQLYVEGVMVDQLKTGDQVDIIGTYLTRAGPGKTGVKLPYVKVHGISSQNKDPVTTAWSEEEEEKYKKFARQNDVFGILGWSSFPKSQGQVKGHSAPHVSRVTLFNQGHLAPRIWPFGAPQ